MKRRFPSYLFIVVVLGILIPACQRPKNVLDRKRMESLMYDIYLAEALMERDYQTFNSPQKKEALINFIFEKYHTSQTQWDTSLVYYSDKIDVYLRMNDSVKARIRREQKAVEAEQNRLVLQNQLIEKRVSSESYIPPIYTFAEADIRPGFRFRLDSAATAELPGENHTDFRFDVIGLPPTNKPTLDAVLMLEYKDTTIYRVNNIDENRSYRSTIEKFIPNDTLKKISGFVRLQNPIGRVNGIQLYNIFLAPPQADSTRLSEIEPGHPPMEKITPVDESAAIEKSTTVAADSTKE